ncbi:MAG: hypothetical protein KJ725_10625 [Gammaproteobacteria bacterium]|nr:hypothetical protein [Gammaproteobacteria bacterium]
MKNFNGLPAIKLQPSYENTNMIIRIILALWLVALSIGCDRTPKADKTVVLANDGIFSADLTDHYALIGRTSGPAELWRLKPRALLHSWKHLEDESGIVHAAISGNERYAVTAQRDSIAWWRIADGALLNVWSLPGIGSVSLSHDGLHALIGLPDKAVYFALNQGRTLYAFAHDKAVLTTALDRIGHYALTGSEDNTAKLWDLTNGTLKYSWPHHNKLATVALSDDGQYALTNAALSQVLIWKTSTGKVYKDVGPKLLTLSAARFSSDSKYVVTGRTSQRIDLWRVSTGKLEKLWRPKKEDAWRPSAATILSLSFTDNESKLWSIAANGYLQRWKK